jgi:hypothetical protein
MFTDKLTLAIAEAAKKCMDEELVGNQHKIDANKNGKVDAHDFKILRKEDTVDEGAIDDLRDRQAAAREANSYKASDKKQDPTKRTVQGHQYGGTKQKPETEIDEAMYNPGLEALASKKRAERTGKPSNPALEKLAHEKAKAKYLNKEEVEQIEESGGKVVFTSGDDHIEAYGEDAFAVYKNNKKQKYYSSLSAAKEALKEEKMSDEDMTQREKIVKGMKKNLQGFKSRYGADAEKVMYATATKQAMKEGAVPSTEKTVTVKHKTSGKEMVVTAKSADKYKSLGYHPVKEEAEHIVEREESPTKGTRKIASYGDHAHTAEVRYNPEYQEYQVHHYKAGKHQGEGPVSYHYDDKADAHSTAKHSVGIKESVVAEEANPTGVKTYHKNKATGKEHATTNFTAKAAAEHEKELRKAGHTITGRALMFGAKEGPRRNVNEEVEQIDEISTETLKSYERKVSDIVSGTGGYGLKYGSASKQRIKNLMKAKYKLADRQASNNGVKEEVEQIDELSKTTLGSYVKKAADDKAHSQTQAQSEYDRGVNMQLRGMGDQKMRDSFAKQNFAKSKEYMDNSIKRTKGISKAVSKLTKEEIEELNELSKGTLGSYVNKAARSARAQAKLGAEFGGESDKDYDKGDMTMYKIRQGIKKDFEAGATKRLSGIKTAVGKLTKEEVELDEAQMTQAQLMKKIKDGTHEVTTDIKPGKHVEVRHTATGKRSMVMVREDVEVLDEASVKLFMGMYQVWHKGKKVASYNSKTDAQDHVNSLKEEVTNDDFKTELEDNKAKAAGTKKQPDIAKASVQAVKQESFSSKLTALKEGVRSYLKGTNNG